jgi:acylphosphatase
MSRPCDEKRSPRSDSAGRRGRPSVGLGALELGLTGYAANKDDGRVHVVARGPRAACQRLLDLLQGGTTPGRVDTVVYDWAAAGEEMTGFVER